MSNVISKLFEELLFQIQRKSRAEVEETNRTRLIFLISFRAVRRETNPLICSVSPLRGFMKMKLFCIENKFADNIVICCLEMLWPS